MTRRTAQARRGPGRKRPAVPLGRHVRNSLLNIAPHSRTGRPSAHRHTSHGALIGLLLVTGVLLFSNLGAMKAYSVSKDGSLNVSVNVLGDPPAAGAVIAFPVTDSVTTSAAVRVSGSCQPDTLVVIYVGPVSSGSVICSAGSFSVDVALQEGINVLRAYNFDGMNQPGPDTPEVLVRYDVPANPAIERSPVASTSDDFDLSPQPLPEQDVPVSPVTSCFDAPKSLSDATRIPRIVVRCMFRNIFAGEVLRVPIAVHGGVAPFAVSIDWGDAKQDLVSLSDGTQHTLQHRYADGGFHTILMKATDQAGNQTQIQTVVSVNGAATAALANPTSSFAETARSVWLESPVPLYIAAVTLVGGFWVGDIFQRFNARRSTKIRPRKP